MPTPESELIALLRDRHLEYPIASKADFLTLMNRSRQPVRFRGTAYGAGFGANLVPSFFFPVTSERDLITKLTELLMSRGLACVERSALAPEAASVGSAPEDSRAAPTTQRGDRAVASLVPELESRLGRPAAQGVLDRETVEALDVVTHALAFVGHPRGLELWREALLRRRFSDEVRQAVVTMLEYLTDAVAEGRTDEVSEICDCLFVVLETTPPHPELHEREFADAR